MTIGARRLDHVVVAVEDVKGAADVWSRTLGLPVESFLQPDGSRLRLAKLPAGNAFVELAMPLTDDHRLARHLRERGQGMFSISIEVEDLDAAVRALRERDVPVSTPEVGVWPGTRVARINRSATHGVSIQLLERRS